MKYFERRICFVFFMTVLFFYQCALYASEPVQEGYVCGNGSYIDKEHEEPEGWKLKRVESKIDSREENSYLKSWCYANAMVGSVYGSIRSFYYKIIRFRNIKPGTKFNADIRFKVGLYGLINSAAFANATAHYKAKISSGILADMYGNYDEPLAKILLWAKTNKREWSDWGEQVFWAAAGEVAQEVAKRVAGDIAKSAVQVVWETASYALDALDVDEAIAQDAWVEFKNVPVESGKEYRLYVCLDSYVACGGLGAGTAHAYIDFMNRAPHEGDDGGRLLPLRGITIKEVEISIPEGLPYPEGVGPNKPDVFIEKMEVSNQSPLVGDTITISATIGNKGNLSAQGFKSILTVNGKGLSEKDIPAIKPGESYDVSWEYKIEQGQKIDFGISLDTTKALQELDEQNNFSVLTVSASSLPDLAVQEYDPYNPGVTVCRIIPSSGQTIQMGKPAKICISVYNLGSEAAQQIALSVKKDDRPFKELSIANIAPRSYKFLEIEWIPETAKTSFFTVTVDPANKIREISESNNSLRLKADVAQPDYEWEISKLWVQPASAQMGDQVRILADVKNAGRREVTVFLDIYVDQTKIKRFYVNVPAGQTETFGDGTPRGDTAVWVARVGTHKVKAVLDTSDYDDYDNSNNTKSMNLVVGSDFAPVAGTDFVLQEKDVRFDGYRWDVRVYNRGDKAALAQVEYKLHYVQGGVLRCDAITTHSANIAGQGYHDFVLRLNARDCMMEIRVDPYNRIAEADESNNTVRYIHGNFEQKVAELTKQQAGAGQGLLQIVKFFNLEEELKLGETRDIGVCFRNVSGQTLKDIAIELTVTNKDVNKYLEKYGVGGMRTKWPSVVNGGEFMVTMPYKAVYPARFNLAVKAKLHIDGKETSVSSGCDFVVSSKGQKPASYYQAHGVDLVIYPEDLRISSLRPKLNENIRLDITARNTGNVAIENVTVLVTADEHVLDRRVLPLIEAHSEYKYSFNQKAEESGLFHVKVRIDPDNLIAETDEFNNETAQDVKVLDAQEALEEQITRNIEKKIEDKKKALEQGLEDLRKKAQEKQKELESIGKKLKDLFK